MISREHKKGAPTSLISTTILVSDIKPITHYFVLARRVTIKINHTLCAIMCHLKLWEVVNTLAFKFLQVIDGLNVLHTIDSGQERKHVMHLRIHAIVEK